MSPRLPSLRPAQVVRALERSGWVMDRQRGSHVSFSKPGVDHIITVPMGRRDVARGTLSSIIKDSGLTQAEFLKLA